jgi:hypothetical protein
MSFRQIMDEDQAKADRKAAKEQKNREKAEEEARQKAEEEARQKAEEEARQKAEEEKRNQRYLIIRQERILKKDLDEWKNLLFAILFLEMLKWFDFPKHWPQTAFRQGKNESLYHMLGLIILMLNKLNVFVDKNINRWQKFRRLTIKQHLNFFTREKPDSFLRTSFNSRLSRRLTISDFFKEFYTVSKKDFDKIYSEISSIKDKLEINRGRIFTLEDMKTAPRKTKSSNLSFERYQVELKSIFRKLGLQDKDFQKWKVEYPEFSQEGLERISEMKHLCGEVQSTIPSMLMPILTPQTRSLLNRDIHVVQDSSRRNKYFLKEEYVSSLLRGSFPTILQKCIEEENLSLRNISLETLTRVVDIYGSIY